MFSAFYLFLYLHILGAIIAFGPGLVFPILGSMGGSEPMHGNFALRVGEAIEMKIVIPVAASMPVTGVLMIVTGNIGLAHFWLIAGIVLYVIAYTFAVTIQRNTVHHMIEMTSHAPAPAAAGPGAAPAGPPPEFLALVRRSQLGGIFLNVMVLVIVLLMVFRPGN
jgi:uncharacterized membrane protein